MWVSAEDRTSERYDEAREIVYCGIKSLALLGEFPFADVAITTSTSGSVTGPASEVYSTASGGIELRNGARSSSRGLDEVDHMALML
jgi:hypothetical protein